jgi:tripartite-type tricarboxylate transporter receptor subunit TctC
MSPLSDTNRLAGWVRMRALALAAAAIAMPAQTRAQDVGEFYKGRSVNVTVGFSVGGGYDLYARHLARYMGKHLPGSPTVVPQNMSGAGSLRAANFLYTAAPKDGSLFGTFSRSIAIQPLLEGNAALDPTKFGWLGSVTHDVSTCITWHTSPIKTWQDFLDKPSNFGGEGPGGEPDMFALLYRSVFGAKVKLVTGYPGTAEITHALERGEVDGLCGISWSTIKSRHSQWLRDKKINVIAQASYHGAPELAGVPLVLDMTKDPEKRQILEIFVATQEMARPFVTPPGIPAARKDALVAAFDATMKDPDYLAEAQRLNMDVNPVQGKAVEAMLAKIYATPKDVVAKAAAAIAR